MASVALLYKVLGVSALVGVATIIVYVPVNMFFYYLMSNYDVEQMKTKDERLKLMNEVKQ